MRPGPTPPVRLSTLGRLHLQGADGSALHSILQQPKRLALLVHLAAPRAAPEPGPAAPTAQSTRLIVLPFRMLRPDPETEFLAFSLPDAVTSSLAGLRSLVVRSNLAALRFSDAHPDLHTIATQADVDVILTGTLLRVGEQLRVSCQLTDAADGTLVWSQSSQVSLGDLFELQDQLTHRIVDSLALPLTARERRFLRHDLPASPGAYQLYLRANQVAYVVGQWSTARDLYLQSIEQDANYAPAWARLGRCYRLIGKWSADEVVVGRNYPAAEAAFRRALLINPDLPLAHNLYAQLEVDLGRAPEAMVRLLSRARAGGASAELYAGLVHACRFCGLLEASLAADREARRLDAGAATSVHHTHFMRGDHERVLDDTFGDIGYIAPLALASLGREGEAIEMLRQSERTTGDNTVRPYLASLRAMLEGDREQSLDALARATPRLRDAEALYYMVRQLARLGEAERALAELERVVATGFFCYPAMARDPWLEPLRGDPRFAEVLRRAELQHRCARESFVQAGGEEVLPLAPASPRPGSEPASRG